MNIRNYAINIANKSPKQVQKVIDLLTNLGENVHPLTLRIQSHQYAIPYIEFSNSYWAATTTTNQTPISIKKFLKKFNLPSKDATLLANYSIVLAGVSQKKRLKLKKAFDSAAINYLKDTCVFDSHTYMDNWWVEWAGSNMESCGKLSHNNSLTEITIKQAIRMLNTTETEPTDWREAFKDLGELVTYKSVDAIKLNNVGRENAPHKILMAYVLQFNAGGFWYNEKGLYAITNGHGSDHASTYKSAIDFISHYK